MRLSQKQVASLIGRTQQSYQILETKDTSFTKPKTLEKIAKVLDTTVEYLTDTEILPMYQSLTEENKQKALEVSRLETRHGQKTSHQTRTLDRKRKHKIKDYCHKATTDLVNQLVSHGVQTLVFGHNTGQKQDINLGKRTNQNFVNIPFTQLIHMLEYKCRVNGIHFIVHEESHTSKCSFIDQESIEYHEDYLGRRIKRGLFESLLGKKYNSDVNGSLNIGRKYLTTINKYTIEMHNKLLSMMGNPRVRTV